MNATGNSFTIYCDPQSRSYAAPYSGYAFPIWQHPSVPPDERLTWDELVARWKEIGRAQKRK